MSDCREIIAAHSPTGGDFRKARQEYDEPRDLSDFPILEAVLSKLESWL